MTDDVWDRITALDELIELLDYLRVDANLSPTRAGIALQLAGIRATDRLIARAQRHRQERTDGTETRRPPRSKVW